MSTIDLNPVREITISLDNALRHTEAVLNVLFVHDKMEECGLADAIEAVLVLVRQAKEAAADLDEWRKLPGGDQ